MKPDLRVFLAYTDVELERYYSPDALELLAQHAEVVRGDKVRVLEGAELAEAAAGCEIVIAHRSVAGTVAAFAAMPALIAFLRGAVDVSTIDLAAASARGILVGRATRGFGRAVAELGVGMMLDLARGIARADHGYKTGVPFVPAKARQLQGSTLGLVGFGHIAEHLADTGRGLGMTVAAFDPHAAAERIGTLARSLNEVLRTSDFVICLAASTPQTKGMFGAEAFARMKPGAFFVNLSRGELVEERALEAALDSGHLKGAGLDVGSGPDQMPASPLALRPDVVATPHIGGMTIEARAHQAMDTARQVVAIATGRMPEGAVNPEAASRVRDYLGRIEAR
ncbi:hydroxyacid dehydrogenase [Variovorax paradoxus]|nr:NAD(P)-dependent oxidoreductase [Variovorax paradoxus]MBT2300980.1 hydroxyacid dehydrogenase [Variovorax paradoxus]